MTVEGRIAAGTTGKDLDTVIVEQTDTALVHREVITLGDPDVLALYAHIRKVGDLNALVVTQAPSHTAEFIGFGEHEITGAVSNVDIWGGPTDVQPEPDPAGYALFVKSDNAADTLAGIGGQVVEVHYLDTAGAEQIVQADMNGTAEVDTGVTDCMFVQEHHVFTVGSNLVAVGNIDCLAGTGGAVISRIAADGNQSMSTMRQVPAGKRVIIKGWHGMGTAATVKQANLRLRSSSNDGVLNAGVYQFHDSVRVKDSGSGHLPLEFIVPALAIVKVSAWSSGSLGVTARWNGFLEDV